MACVSSFTTRLSQKRDYVNGLLSSTLDKHIDINDDLKKAMAYSLESPGKRVRAALVLWCSELIGGESNSYADTAAVAIEMVHTYSLIHDDLPAMDDDDLRRGRATCHVAFNEAMAILAGDALLTMAFEILAGEIDNPEISSKLILELSQASGPAGMIAGQAADLRAENVVSDMKMLEYIHLNKTAKMFKAAAVMGAISANADSKQIKALSEYGMKIGLGFQIADDILDVCSSSEQLGKTAGKDEKAGKLTYPSLIGLEQSRVIAERITNQAVESLANFGERADVLRELALTLLNRTK
ncbi:MAG TPA: polyprenyl synthetase family protein [Sedimentisphaerales bacterium]|nr:polyprenyl synthetase family protein [Sedimentisphaerales bacterium]